MDCWMLKSEFIFGLWVLVVFVFDLMGIVVCL